MKAHKFEDGKMNNESRIVRVETVIEHIHYMLEKIDKRFDQVDENTNLLRQEMKEGFNKVDNRFLEVDKKIDRLDSKIDSNFKWIVGTIITLFVLNGALPAITKMVSTLITR